MNFPVILPTLPFFPQNREYRLPTPALEISNSSDATKDVGLSNLENAAP
jgi:hypothetical protein